MKQKIGRIERQTNSNVLGRQNPINAKCPTPNGQHGKARALKKTSEYAKKLIEAKKFRTLYNYKAKQLQNLITKIQKTKKSKKDLLIELSERKLDVFVFRSKFAVTPMAARQLVVHGNILVNGEKITHPSYKLKVGDIVSISDRLHSNPHILSAMSSPRKVPAFVEINTFKSTMVQMPSLSNTEFYCEINLNFVMERFR